MRPRFILPIVRLYLFALAGLLFMIRPVLPGNASILDFVNAAFFGLFLLYLLFYKKLETRLLVPVLVIAFGSLLATINSPTVNGNIMAMAQEAYLYVFFIMLFNIIETRSDLKFLARFWFLGAGVVGAIALMELAADPTLRARATFENPNMASSYLGVSLFFILIPGLLPGRLFALPVLGLIVAGVVCTKSLSALVAVCCAGAALGALTWGRASGRQRFRLVVAAGFVILIGATLMPQLLGMKNYAGRLDNSAGGRNIIWQAGLETFVDNPFGIGIGPSGFKDQMVLTGGPFKGTARKELHSDFLAFLVERGIIGFAGLVALLGGLAFMAWRSVRRATDTEGLLISLSLLGMFLYILVDSLSHEMFHYRHVWAVLALIAAQDRLMARSSVARAPATPWPSEARPRLV